MQQTKTPVSKVKMAVTWLIFVGVTLCWIAFLLWRHRAEPVRSEEGSDIVRFIISFVVGGFFFVAGITSYFVVLLTNCFTFNFQRPVWPGVKGKLYLANIAVLTGLALGIGFGITPFIAPLLTTVGLSGQMAFLIPVMGMVVILQIVRVFVLIWAPLEKRLITRRLQARGISPAQLQPALPVGISNPERSSFKKLTMVEEDIGALWVGPDQLIYWGDNDQFAITRDQLTQVERRADAGGTTMLGGVTHLILHVRLPDGSNRQIRFHTEGCWSMAGKGRAMDDLEQRIQQWLNQCAVA